MSVTPDDLSWLDDRFGGIHANHDKAETKANGHDKGAATTYPLVWYGDIDGAANYEQIVRGLLLKGSFFVVYGESNSGKTFFALDLALAVAQGKLWRGQKTKPGLVIYVAGEGAASVRNRVSAYRKANDITAMPFAIVPLAVDFMSDTSVAQLIATIKAAELEAEQPATMVIIDTLARAMAGGEENSSLDMGLVVAAADKIRADTGAALGFIHHSGKDAARGARGSSALRAATDTEILVEGTTGPRTVTVMKQRDLEPAPKMVFTLQVVEIGTNPDDFMPVTSCVVVHSDESAIPVYTPEPTGKNQRLLLGALRARTKENGQKPLTLTDLRQIAKEIGIGKSSAHLAVDTLTMSPFMKPFGGGYIFTDGDN